MTNNNATEISDEFSLRIGEYFQENKPTKIIETGLYHGKGSTTTIASLIKNIPIPEAYFFSIECNPEFIEIAKTNLVNAGLGPFVKIVQGLSVPRYFLPSLADINRKIALASELPNVKVDHEQDIVNGAKYYQKETAFPENDDKLGEILRGWDGCVDFILLDSGGHIGTVEFEYTLSKLRGPCVIALDDIYHIKHFESYGMMRNDPRFKILHLIGEKFGSVISRFTPNL